jgi:hypothetical protein
MPPGKQRRHTVEMQESLAGQWPAQGNEGSRLERLPGKGEQFTWKLNKTYRLELSLTAQSLTGRILDGYEDVAQFGYKFPPKTPAVRAGRPAVRANGLRARFGNATVTVHKTAPEPVAKAPVFPAWAARKGPMIAKGTGFFRTIEKGGRWWLVDPRGQPFFAVGADHVNYRAHWCEKLGYAPYHKNVAAKFGGEDAWAASALERLKSWGFNTLSAGHSPSTRHRGLPHILFASFGAGFAKREWICEPAHWTGFPDVFSPRWPSHCRYVARKLAKESRGDPWCIGTFLDNELEWYGKKGFLVDEVFQRGPKQPAKQALHDWLVKRFGGLHEANRALGTSYADRKAFLAATTVPKPSAGLTEARNGFLAEIAERYFGVAAGLMREADPDHLIMGCRFAGRAPEATLAAAGRHNDVVTFNTYPRVDFENEWTPGVGGVVHAVPRQLSDYFKVVRKPMIITEWSFPALDSGLPCKHGAGMRVDTQAQRAACYRIFANAMSDLPFLAGYHYFMWADEPALGIRSTFPEDSNYGLVNEKDEPYAELVATATEVNRQAAARHAASAFSGDLSLRAVKGALEVVNTNAVSSHGWLRVTARGKSKIEQVRLRPRSSRRITTPLKDAWCAELQRWDGTKTRLAGGKPVAPPGVAGAAGDFVETERLEVKTEGVTWLCSRKDGSLFDGIQAGGLPLGRLVFAAHQDMDGRDYWAEADKVVSLKAQAQPDAVAVDAVVERTAAGAAFFRAAVRVVVFKRGGLAFVKPLWVESSDPRPWRLVEAFVFCRPAIGGSPDGDAAGGPDVPNYYRAAQFWTDSRLGGCFGAIGQPDGWNVTFWKGPSGSFHPDARIRIEQELRQGGRWTDDGVPWLWLFASRDANGWRDIARLARQAQDSLLTK